MSFLFYFNNFHNQKVKPYDKTTQFFVGLYCQAQKGHRTSQWGGGGLFSISRAGGGHPEDSGPVSQTKRLHKSRGPLVLRGLSEFTLV